MRTIWDHATESWEPSCKQVTRAAPWHVSYYRFHSSCYYLLSFYIPSFSLLIADCIQSFLRSFSIIPVFSTMNPYMLQQPYTTTLSLLRKIDLIRLSIELKLPTDGNVMNLRDRLRVYLNAHSETLWRNPRFRPLYPQHRRATPSAVPDPARILCHSNGLLKHNIHMKIYRVVPMYRYILFHGARLIVHTNS